MKQGKKKAFVLDTNVVLHDSTCILNFKDNDVVIPITVLEELDHFKKGNDTVNFHARAFARAVDELSGDKLFDEGIPIGPDLGNIVIKLDRELHPDIRHSFSSGKPDHQILNTAYWIAKEHPETPVILVSKDVNLRMKAKAVGVMAQDYTTDHVKDVSALYTGKRVRDGVPEALIDRLYKDPYEVEADGFGFEEPPTPNEFMVLRNGKKSALATYDAPTQTMRHVDKTTAYGITPRNAEQTFAMNALMNDKIQLVSLSGKAGTGKTLLALAAALERRGNYRQIYMARPIVPLSNKDIGFLPGDIESKLSPYMQPLFDNLGVIQHQFSESDAKSQRIKELLDEQKLVIAPLSYIRGRSLVKIYFIVDEAQNLTPHEVKTIITRAGEGTKMVFTGDIFQIDHPYLDSRSNGLSYMIEKMKGQGLYAHINLEKGERSLLAELASDLL
ncbi:PhoH family protein [Candidatus Sumerlaeota bacterium]|nr:PhoH family protein [Candidatus Sumerlaeota bacterium]